MRGSAARRKPAPLSSGCGQSAVSVSEFCGARGVEKWTHAPTLHTPLGIVDNSLASNPQSHTADCYDCRLWRIATAPLSLRDTLRSLSRVFCAPAVRYSLVRRFAPGVRSLSRVFLSCEGACRAMVLFRRSVPGEGRCTVLRRSRGWGRAGRSFPFLRSVGLFRSFSL